MSQIKLPITKSARKFGYFIWNWKTNQEIERILSGKDKVHVFLNGFDLGEKNIDRKYHRISLGFKFTRALPESHDYYAVTEENGKLEVTTFNGSNQQ